MKYLVVIEKTNTGYSVYSPDIPGCVATGCTEKEALENMSEAVQFHLDGLRMESMNIPVSSSHSAYINVS